MKNPAILIFEAVLVLLIVLAGLSGRQILFIHGPRSAVITLGVIGMLLCTISIGKFITAAPAGALSIAGYALGAVCLFIFAVQLFRWNVPVVGDARVALWMMAGCVVLKGVIGRFG